MVDFHMQSHILAKLGTNTSEATFKLISVRKIIQIIEAMLWVRCASGNVFWDTATFKQPLLKFFLIMYVK